MLPSSELERVYTTNDLLQAQLIVDALNAAELPAQLVGDNLWQAAGELAAASIAIQILVHADHVNNAKQIVAEYDGALSKTKNAKPDWNCRSCGEENAGSFDLCWKCQTDRVAM